MAETFDQLLEESKKRLEVSPSAAPSFDTLLRESAAAHGDDLSKLGMDDLTRAAVVSAHEQLMRNAGQPPVSEDARRMGVRPGTPMEVNEGVPASVRGSLGLDPDSLNQFKVLARRYGIDNVEVADNGAFVLRNQTDPVSGIKQDVLVNPPGFESGDVAQLGAQAVPMIAGIVAARAGMRAPITSAVTRTLLGVGAAAGAQRYVEGEQQAAVRLFRGDEVNLPAIVKERALDATEDAIFGTMLAGGGATLRTISPFSRLTPELEQATAARARLNKQLINQLPETPGLKTGSPFLLRSEAQARRIPGSAGVFDSITKQEQASVDELRRIALGVPRAMTDEELAAALPQADLVGQKALGVLGNTALQAEGAAQTAQQAVQRIGTTEAQLTARVMAGAPVETTLVGKNLIQKVKAAWDDFHAFWGDRYNEFFARPETTALDVNANKLANLGTQLKEDFTPLVKKLKETPTGLVNELGEPILTSKETVESLDQFVQSKVISALEGLKDLAGGETSIRSLKQIRTNIDDAIAQNLAIPGTDTAQLIKIRGVLTNTISDALKDKDPALLKEWQTLNEGWRKNMARFDFNKIRDILIKPGQPGAPGETEVAERVLGNSAQAMDAWTAYREFFGADSPEMLSLKQAVRSKVIEGSLDGARGYIAGSDLRSNLENLRPEIAKQVFGIENKTKLLEVADALSTAQGKFDAGEVLRLANSKTLTAKALLDLQSAETTRAETYSNALINAARKGALREEVIQPSEFVRYMTNGRLRLDPDDIRLVMGVLEQEPKLAQQVKQLAVEDFFETAKMGKANPLKMSQAIDKTLGDEVQGRRWEALVGRNTVQNLHNLADALRPGSIAAEAFASAGGMSGGAVTAKISGGKFEGLPGIAKRMILAKLYTNTVTRNLLANNLMSADTTLRAVNALVTSEPFATEVFRRFGPDASRDVMSGIRNMLNQLYGEKAESRVGVPTRGQP